MLLGRERECAVIDSALAVARDSGGTGVLVLGEAGIGKSALLAYAAEQAHGMLVLRASGVESEMHLTWAGLHSLLRPHADAIGLLPVPQQAALRSALGLEDSPNRGPFLVSAAVVSLLGSLADQQPVVVLVDDVQWMDRESVEALAFASRRFNADRVCMIFACRDTEPDAPDAAALGNGFLELVVNPLDSAASEEFLDARVSLSLDHRIRSRITEAARGNPLALLELSEENAISDLESGSVPLAARLEQGFLRRVHALSQRTQLLLLIAAADDSPDVHSLLAAGAQIDVGEPELVDAARSRLIEATDDAVEFAHPLVRSAIYREAPAEQRRLVHRVLAGVTTGTDPSRSTWHLAAATTGPDEEVSRALEDLAREAQRRGAMQTSASAYRRAAQLTVDVERQARCLTCGAEASWESGDIALASQLVESARAIARTPGVISRAEHLRGRLHLHTGIVLEGFEILYAAATAASAAKPRTAAWILVDAYRAASYDGLGDQVRRAGSLARDLVQTDGAAPAPAAFVAGAAALWERNVEVAAPLLQSVVDRGDGADDAGVLILASMASLYLGDNAGGVAYGTRAAVLAREHGALATLANALEMVSFAELPFSLDRAESSAIEGLQSARETHRTPSVAVHLSMLSTIAAYRGQEEACLDSAGQVFELARRHGLALAEGRAVAALGLLDLTLGRPTLAMDRLERLLETTVHPVIRLSIATDLVEAASRADCPDRVAGVVALVSSWADSSDSPAARAVATRCLALISEPDKAVTLFEESLGLQQGRGETSGLARTHLLLGEHLRRLRQRSAARPHLRAAWDTFDRLGAAPWAERARTELRATGESARSRTTAGLEDLTPQERHIACLVAEGASSKQVAAQLFLSPRTVDYHLRKVFTKTGISSRTELRALDLNAET